MFANWVEETATGTTGDLALQGATTGRISVSDAFADGQSLAYEVDDSGGTLKESGVGHYETTGDKIVRDRPMATWSGSVYDSTNPTITTLSGGTHTVRVAAVAQNQKPVAPRPSFVSSSYSGIRTIGSLGNEPLVEVAMIATEIQHNILFIPAGFTIGKIAVKTGVTIVNPSLAKMGICSMDFEGNTVAVLAETAEFTIDTATFVENVAMGTPYTAPTDMYVWAWIMTDDNNGIRGVNRTASFPHPYFSSVGTDLKERRGYFKTVGSYNTTYPLATAFGTAPDANWIDFRLDYT